MATNKANILLSRSRPLAIVIMLSLALALIAVLGWQSWGLQRSHLETADSVLREYAILAADEFGRRAIAGLGYEGYYTLISRIGNLDSASKMRAEAEADSTLADAASLAATYFVITSNSRDVTGEPLVPAVDGLLGDLLAEDIDTSAPYHSRRTGDGAGQVIFALRPTPQGMSSLAGFVVSNSGISAHLDRVFSRGPLLPPSLAGGLVSNDMLFARVTDPAGIVVFEEKPEFDSHLTVNRILGSEYQGILQNFKVQVSLDTDSAESLVIGGLPRSRLPLLLLAMFLVVALMVTAIWLFRREQAVMKLRSDFVSQVSHELRTPLTQIRMFAETLLMDRTRNDGERRRSLEIINRESQRLSHLVDNILQFSNGSEHRQIERRGQLLGPIIEEVCDIVRSTNNAVNISVLTDDSAFAEVDADAIRQIVLNLLENAIKFGPPGQQIRVVLGSEADTIRLIVEDEGPGIPRSEHERVFSPFYRMRREEKTAISGTGIGLSVVRELTEAMGGRCYLEDCRAGTRVSVEFPGGSASE